MKKALKIVSLYKGFSQIGGAEKVAVQVHKMLKSHFGNCFLMSSDSYSEIHKDYNICPAEYIRLHFFTLLQLRNCVVISHHRKNTSIIFLLNKVFNLGIRLIHIAHNEFFDLKYFAFYPDKIITVSERVKDNLVADFNIKANSISVIYNGVADNFKGFNSENSYNENCYNVGVVRILYGARITDVKGQIRLVKQLKGKIPKHIKIDFAGIGDQDSLLTEVLDGDSNFRYIGYINFTECLFNYDYFMLFSSNEGLPLSLIEACSFKLPIICNDVGGNTEIVEHLRNGFIINNYNELVVFFNKGIPHPASEIYLNMSEYSRTVYETKFREDIMKNKYINYVENLL